MSNLEHPIFNDGIHPEDLEQLFKDNPHLIQQEINEMNGIKPDDVEPEHLDLQTLNEKLIEKMYDAYGDKADHIVEEFNKEGGAQ